MDNDKLKVSWDDLKSDAVEEKLRKQQVIEETRKAYESAPAPQMLFRNRRTSIWYNTIFYMTLFGFLGGLTGWAIGWGIGAVFNIRDDIHTLQTEAMDLRDAVKDIDVRYADKQFSETQWKLTRQTIVDSAADNEYFKILDDASLTPQQRDERFEKVNRSEEQKNLIAHMLFFGMSGLMISLALGMAESIVARNVQAAIINGAVGATMGLMGGLAGSLMIDHIYNLISGPALEQNTWRGIIAHSLSWGVLGLFISAAPGAVIRNKKRLIVGIIGGVIGGLIGGALFDPIANLTRGWGDIDAPNRTVGNLVGIISIGMLAGLCTGLIENVAKSGWLRVVAGLIAGKQFVVYRNPTYIGSAPQCQIYLFRDEKVGRRHAAIHVMQGGFEIEDLPLGGQTIVNGRAITRTKLRNGDKIEIGKTAFVFQEKTRPAA